MQKILQTALFIFIISLVSCNSTTTNKETTKNDSVAKTTDSSSTVNAPVVGNDKDSHDCIGSAGYTWSVIKNECIRLFESALRLKENGDDGPAEISAFVIFSKDEKQAELFLPNSEASLILKLEGEEGGEQWVNGDYHLFPWKGGFVLNKGDKMIYAGHPGDE